MNTFDERRRRLAALEGLPAEDVRDLRAGQTHAWWAEMAAAAEKVAPQDEPQSDSRRLLDLLGQVSPAPNRAAVLAILAQHFAEHAEHVPCSRCGWPCRTGVSRNPEATLLRIQDDAQGTGVCSACNITAFFQDERLPFCELFRAMDEERRKSAIKSPQVHEMVAELVRTQPGGMDGDPAEIVWERVNLFWHLPHPRGTYGKKRRRRAS